MLLCSYLTSICDGGPYSPQEGSENEEEEREEEEEENTDYLTDSNKENETDEENNVRLSIIILQSSR